MKSENEILDRIYNLSGDPEETRDAYKDWAERYDDDTVEGMGYVAPAVASDKLSALLPDTSIRILDAGCGTGLAGVELNKRGYQNVDGMDLSPDMLAMARRKEVYDDLREADMTETLDYPDNAYDAIICVGAFTHAHVGPKGFDELVRITRPGGAIVATVHEDVWDADKYADYLRKLEASGKAKIREADEADYHINKCRLVVLEPV
ncbi:class I SAM-dependent DNA methyltransferase [Oceanicaulis sp. LC35]|uniref:class I SAM-dependent DNA methyltransferase n=1 Tax=Oceanicaulis sp. LC35 TaxID=3349635 RepID=UPI003F84B7B6